MKKILLMLLCGFQSIALADTWPSGKPQLVVVLVIDQFRADYLSRFQDKFSKKGFQALIDQGAYFPFGEYDLLQSMTGPGHATVLTGAYPYQMGIPLNDWYDQKAKDVRYCVQDTQSKTVGAASVEEGSSPRNLVGTTVGDEVKNAGFASRFYAIALKDRAAILMGGHRADAAIWFDKKSNRWISSDYYMKDRQLPVWVQEINAQVAKEKCDLNTPCGITMTADAAALAIEKLKLGANKGVDFLAVSFSSHDYAGHKHGPNAPIMETMTLTEDKAIEKLRDTIQNKVPGGLKNVLFVLTGDHGIPPHANILNEAQIENEFLDEKKMSDEIEKILNKKFGRLKSNWITYVSDLNFYLNEEVLAGKKISLASVEGEIQKYLRVQNGIAHVFTSTDVDNRTLPGGMFERKILKTFYRGRSGNVIAIPKPYYTNVTHHQVTHMTAYTYDRTVPIIISGFGIRPGVYAEKAEVVDIAPTLSFILGVVPPSISEGRVLREALKSVTR